MSDAIGKRIAARARELQEPMIAFLRDIVAIARPFGTGRGRASGASAREMEAVGFDEVRIDAAGQRARAHRQTARG